MLRLGAHKGMWPEGPVTWGRRKRSEGVRLKPQVNTGRGALGSKGVHRVVTESALLFGVKRVWSSYLLYALCGHSLGLILPALIVLCTALDIQKVLIISALLNFRKSLQLSSEQDY